MLRSLLLAACIFACAISTASAARYTFTDVGALGAPDSTSQGFGINDFGDITGLYSLLGKTHAFLYSSGVFTDLGSLSGDSLAFDVNNQREVVGVYNLRMPGQQPRAFVYRNNVMTSLSPTVGSQANSINDAGQIVGIANAGPNGQQRPVFFANDTITPIVDISGGAFGINAAGLASGFTVISGSSERFGAIFDNGNTIKLATLGGDNLGGGAETIGFAINASGQVTGHSSIGTDYHAFFYSGGVMHDLGTLGGGIRSEGYGINDAGQVVGYSSRQGQLPHAFLYEGAGMIDLNTLIDPTLGWELFEARAINNRGQITGYARRIGVPGSLDHVFLLTPVPEPSSNVVAAIGAIGLLFAARRKR